ncbi:uncharacterized protein LOC107621065 [Arachis ipaensis]|uniref:uncharacterized protein LOC107621065 n=1 Tax=Arachis ipaensis TaxID=130454 RepID=UPI000A2B6A0F|nr:uncharacterized protein LOC107621065 [Arachis ipaensis]
MNAVESQHRRMFFLYGHGGTGKTFLWKTLASALRSKGQIVLTVASTGIASLLLPEGRAAHSRFAIPLTPDEFSTCNIKQGSPLAELIVRVKLIIWDEAHMMSKFCFEALDKTMKDLMRFKHDESPEMPFGGKTIVFGGDFRQILPVIPKGTRQDIVNASLNSSYLWQHCEILKLTINMQLESMAADSGIQDLQQFAEWILHVDNGISKGMSDECNLISILPEFLITYYNDPIEAIVEAIYSDYIADMDNEGHLKGRAILAPTINAVDEVNDYMIELNNNACKSYVSSNKCLFEGGNNEIEGMHTPEILATIKCSGVPNYELKLRVGCPVMLIRNIDRSSGLCNGTRLIITRLGDKVIDGAEISQLGNYSKNSVIGPNGLNRANRARIEPKAQSNIHDLMSFSSFHFIITVFTLSMQKGKKKIDSKPLLNFNLPHLSIQNSDRCTVCGHVSAETSSTKSGTFQGEKITFSAPIPSSSVRKC